MTLECIVIWKVGMGVDGCIRSNQFQHMYESKSRTYFAVKLTVV